MIPFTGCEFKNIAVFSAAFLDSLVYQIASFLLFIYHSRLGGVARTDFLYLNIFVLRA